MRVLTWNINGGYPLISQHGKIYSETEDLSYIIKQLATLDADILCLQEVHTNQSRSQTREIAEKLSYPYIFETMASNSHIDPAYNLANAILSKQPFTAAKAICLPRPNFLLELPLLPNGQRAEIHDKYLQVVQFETFTLANIHTLPLHVLGSSYASEDGKTFAGEVEKVFLEHFKAPLIFCGDFNYSDITTLYPKLFDELGLVNVLPNQPSVPTSTARIDYILCSSKNFHTTNAAIYPVLADHFPCGLEVTPDKPLS
jgi:endonuclease/exonuclease/phosphatase family metal-dependent hydrolase